MSLVHNEFESKPEIILITYDEVIKSPYPFLLNKINKKLSFFYKEYLDIDKFNGLDMKNLVRFCIQRTDKHLFRYLSKIDFDVETSLKQLLDRYFEVYEESPLLEIGESLILLLSQKFTKKVYIHTEVYDIRVHMDIQNTYKDMERVVYVAGDFGDVLDKIEEDITSYFINDLDYLDTIVEKGKAEYTNIMLANYAYNYILGEDGELEYRLDVEKLLDGIVCKFATFSPVHLTEEHFSQVELDKA